jgi:hypothetical protein
MTQEQLQSIIDLREPPTMDDNDWEMLDGVLHGNEALPISHEGGELQALTELHEHVGKTYVPAIFVMHAIQIRDIMLYSRNTRTDTRTRRDRTENRQQLFQPQLDAITDAYMAWTHDVAHGATYDAGAPGSDNSYSFTIFDVFGACITISN